MSPLRLLVLAAALVAAPPGLRAQEDAAPVEEPAFSDPYELAKFLREAHSGSTAELGQRIAAAGPRMSLAILLALRDQTCPVTETGAMVIGPVEEEVLLHATRGLGRGSFSALFAKGVPENLDEDARRALLLILSEVGRAGDLDFALDVMAGDTAPAPRLVAAFEEAAAGIFARDPRAVSGLRGRFLDLHEELTSALARAVARTPSHPGLELLIEGVGFRDSLDPMLLSLATRTARGLDGPFDEVVQAKARACLTDADFQVLRQAATTVAELEDFESTELLIGLLDHPQAGVRNSAHRALCELTGLGLRPESAGWSSWLETELRWYQDEAPAQRRVLAHGSPVQVAEALNELAQHRYERHRTALEIAQVLEHDNPLLRKRACVVLRQLASRAPVGSLIDCLEDDAAVAAEAHQTLRVLTGEDLPDDPEAWRAAPGNELPG